MFAFSNGLREDVNGLLQNTGLDGYFQDVISVDEIKSFKPNPAVYCHFIRRSDSTGSESWLISSNPFDVIGAVSSGMRAVWIKRSADAIFDPWEILPTVTVSSLVELKDAIIASTENS
jgi:2-haloacid dehalogenase